MTFDEYIKNPMGSTVMTNLSMYKTMYTEKWDKIMVRENGIVTYKLYTGNDDYYAHFKIPSEVVPKFYYDVIVRFYPPEGKTLGVTRSLSQYDVQFYSNDPNFVFTFAHAFKKNKMLIKDLESKMSVTAIKEKAVMKNPHDDVGYVKSLYFLYLAMKKLNLFSRSAWEVTATKYSKNIWSSTVTHADDKIKRRQELGEAIRIEQKKESNNDKNIERTKSTSTFNKNDFIKKDFGHFKKTNFNTISSNRKKNGKRGFGIFKKSFK